MFGIAYNLNQLTLMNKEEIRHLFINFIQNDSLLPEVLKEDIASKDKVLSRLNAAREIFAGL